MGKTSIEWSHYTFNAWWGCLEVSPECNNCYARELDHRFPILGQTHWGKEAPRRFFGDAHWAEPLKWNRKASRSGVRERVFSGSMCDICEDRRDLDEHRARLLALIRDTPSLDWLLLTKRPQNYSRLFRGVALSPNVWAGTTVGVRKSLWRIDALREVPAPVRFLSVEPLLEDLGSLNLDGIDWVIVGGESGRGARPMDLAWVRSIVKQCRNANTACFVKQLGALPIEYDLEVAMKADAVTNIAAKKAPWIQGFTRVYDESGTWLQRLLKLADKKGGDVSEWPHDLRLRELPREGGRER